MVAMKAPFKLIEKKKRKKRKKSKKQKPLILIEKDPLLERIFRECLEKEPSQSLNSRRESTRWKNLKKKLGTPINGCLQRYLFPLKDLIDLKVPLEGYKDLAARYNRVQGKADARIERSRRANRASGVKEVDCMYPLRSESSIVSGW